MNGKEFFEAFERALDKEEKKEREEKESYFEARLANER